MFMVLIHFCVKINLFRPIQNKKEGKAGDFMPIDKSIDYSEATPYICLLYTSDAADEL